MTKAADTMSAFAKSIMEQKYSHDLGDGTKETWENISYRVSKHVMKAVNAPKTLVSEIQHLIAQRKFIPGGRYLYASGRPMHQVQNCLLLRAEDSREGWAALMQKSTLALMTGAGIGVDYSDIRPEGKLVRKTGGFATGPLALMQMINEAGRGIMQGGSRRSAIWAGLNWKHADIHKFIGMKNWSPEVRELKLKNFDFPATSDGTNISVLLDDEFFKAFKDEKHSLHSHAHSVYWAVVEQMLKTAEPGFSIDVGKNSGETLRNACVSGDTEILTKSGYLPIESVSNQPIEVWNGFEWSTVIPKITGYNQPMLKVTLSNGMFLRCTEDHKFVISTDYFGSQSRIDAKNLNVGMKLIKHEFPILSGGEDIDSAYAQGFHSAEGMDDYNHLTVYDKKQVCLSRLENNIASKSPAENKTRIRWSTEMLSKSFVPFDWSVQSRLDWLAGWLDGDACETKNGAAQGSSINHEFIVNIYKLLTTLGVSGMKITKMRDAELRELPDGRGGKKEYQCQPLYRLLIGAAQIERLKSMGMKCERLKFESIPNRDASKFVQVISVEPDDVDDIVYCFNEPLRHTGCFNGIVTGQCTEITSRDDSDICNLGSINLARIESVEEMETVVNLATAFLLAGTVYSDLPYPEIDRVRTKNRRLGLGLMGIHEWLLLHGKTYNPDNDLQKYLEVYETSTKIAAGWADKWDLSKPVKTRALAPTGTIGIVAETTTGIEPIFCSAYKRRYKKGIDMTAYQYVLDPTAKKLVEMGVDPEKIEDAYTLAENVERRVEFQAWVQRYVDHSISSTVNLPAWGSELNNSGKVHAFGNMLMKYLPQLRGMTVYPDGARGGQPLTPIKYSTASKHAGEVFIEQADVCDITKGGTCGA